MTDNFYPTLNKIYWKDKKVFVTGHTGFKGAWLTLLLLNLGCDVYGFSLSLPSDPCLFKQLNLQPKINHFSGDIRDHDLLGGLIENIKPNVVFHLAAQPLVRESYLTPVDTWSANVMGSIHFMEALRRLDSFCCAIMITTDKVYSNHEWVYSYRENDPLGGFDPYSSSKAAAELAISSWRSSFFNTDKLNSNIKIASARSGNVIGGGDWANDRLVPDIVRSLINSQVVDIRNPYSTRPWQHVLDPLFGYLLLAERLDSKTSISNAFNFGPSSEGNRSVSDLVKEVFKTWPGAWKAIQLADSFHEAKLLNLATELAYHELSWKPRWGFPETVFRTINWYKHVHQTTASPYDCCMDDIKAYFSTPD